MIILHLFSVCPFKSTVCFRSIAALWIHNHSCFQYTLYWSFKIVRLLGKLGKGHTNYDQIGMSRCKSLTFVLKLNIWKNEYLMNQNQVFFISGWLTFPLFENIYKALLKTNSLFKRTKLIQPQFNTVNEHSIKQLPMYWLRKMHKRKDLNLGDSINSILKIDSRLVIDHKWQEIHLSLLKSPFYLAVFPSVRVFTPGHT